MSRIGKQPVVLTKGVKAQKQDNNLLLEGAKGKLSLKIPQGIDIEIAPDKIIVKRSSDDKIIKSAHGTIRAIINNMVKGVTEGYKKELEVIGVGYKSQLKGTTLILNLGFSHPVVKPIPTGLKLTVPNPNRITIEGADKQMVGQFASEIRAVCKPEPYQGKGIRYLGEIIKKKLGKALAKA